MKLVSFSANSKQRIGFIDNGTVVDLAQLHPAFVNATGSKTVMLPPLVIPFLEQGEAGLESAREAASWWASQKKPMNVNGQTIAYKESDVRLLAPVPRPTSMRDGYAFRQHVEAARRNRGLEMIPEFDQIPIFYFTNHQSVTGPGEVEVMEKHCDKLDFELECAIVIGKEGKNIPASKADDYIAGYTIMNDWSARGLQMEEMKLNLGPAKGKDFATSIGPWLVTRDELSSKRIATPVGEKYDLAMKCFVNGKQVSTGTMKDMTWTFAQIIERASYGVTLYPGDVIGSGTCGTGCFLELNGSKVYDPAWWLKPGDEVVCEIEMLGSLKNTLKLV